MHPPPYTAFTCTIRSCPTACACCTPLPCSCWRWRYSFAGIYLYHTYAGRAGGNPLIMTYEDIVVAYSGSGKGSRLESALRGPMSSMLPHDETKTIIALGAGGCRSRATYEKRHQADPRPALHGLPRRQQSASPEPERIRQPEEGDRESIPAPDIFTLVRVSHIHLFGLTFVFFIMGADVQPRLRAPGMVQVHRRGAAVPLAWCST